MPAPASILHAQLDALLNHVGEYRAQREALIRADSEQQVRRIRAGARAEARASLHAAVMRERARLRQALRQAGAQAESERRQRAQLGTLALLSGVWPALELELAHRWADEGLRRAWVVAALAQAARLLPARRWRIEHAAGLSPEDRTSSEAQAGAAGAGIDWHEEPALRAGLRVRAGSVGIDASITGLLVERADIEAMFLSEYLATAARGATP